MGNRRSPSLIDWKTKAIITNFDLLHYQISCDRPENQKQGEGQSQVAIYPLGYS